ncbi:hypothetical protein QC764_0099030 [Podospora pseudoanserina]|uniref:Uncharacterized protein n=1 Tax=Podospora pseudoanserina TaxID=2609844 RepID=A0ABR0HUJ9_9PEZI|nr:hypothetical protein QC764_0099030 [Podospora pseudoanserina]
MLIHEPIPQFRLALRLFVWGMHHWRVEEMATISHMVNEEMYTIARMVNEPSPWDGLGTLVTLPLDPEIGQQETPRTYYDPIILASLRKYKCDRSRQS